MLYDIHSLKPDWEIDRHYSDPVSREPHALFESGEDGVVVIRFTFDDREEINLRALFDIICMDTLNPAIPVWVLKVRILGFDHPSCCPECIRCEECVTEEESSVMGRNVMEFIPLYFSLLQDLSFVKSLQLHPVDSCCRLRIWRRWCQIGDLDPTH